MSRRGVYGVILAAVILAVLFGFLPNLRHFIWTGIVWGIFAVSAIVVVGVAINILTVILSMYIGYRPEGEELRAEAKAPAGTPRGALRLARSRADNQSVSPANRLEEALAELRGAEYTLSSLESGDLFQAFTDQQKRQYHQALREVRILIWEVSKETANEKLAS
jgi:hypothetical protein